MKQSTIIFLAILILVAGMAGFLASVPVRDQTQQMHNAVLSLEKASVGQSFKATRDNLYRVDLFTAGDEVPKGGELTLILGEDPTFSAVVRRATVKARRIRNNQYLSFVFPLIADSRGRRFYFRVLPENFRAKSSYVWFYSSEEVYGSGKGFRGVKEIGGDLQFSSLTKTPLLEAAKIIFSRVAENKPTLFNSAAFYLAPVALYLLVSVLLMVELWPKRS